MTEEEPKSEIEKLRDEFTAQMSEIRETYQKDMAAKDKELKELREYNEQLNREIVRSSLIAPPAPAAPEMTEEEIYSEKVSELGKRCAEKIVQLS